MDCHLSEESNINLTQFNELDPTLSGEVVSLLQEFDDIFLQEIPSGLPLVRGIKHQFDFIPRAATPNRPAYKSNLEDTKELEHQVNELLTKGWVTENLSPCAVPNCQSF